MFDLHDSQPKLRIRIALSSCCVTLDRKILLQFVERCILCFIYTNSILTCLKHDFFFLWMSSLTKIYEVKLIKEERALYELMIRPISFY